MTDEPKTSKTLEQLETEIVGLKIRLRRVESFIESMPTADDYLESPVSGEGADEETLYDQAEEIVRQYDRVSASLLQRRLSIGYARAARLVDMLESKGVVSPSDGSSAPRMVLPKKDEAEH